MKLGIMGGTFNPIHLAHLRIAEEAREALGLDRVLFIPAASPPHKEVAGALSFAHRFEMTRLAIAGNPFFDISDMESARGGTSYSVDTLRQLRREQTGDDLFFIMGSDSFAEIGLWHDFAAIFSLASLVVVGRPGTMLESLLEALPSGAGCEFTHHPRERRLEHSSGCAVHYIEGVPLDISSSAVRSLAGAGHSIRYLVPDGVEHYIRENRIYD